MTMAKYLSLITQIKWDCSNGFVFQWNIFVFNSQFSISILNRDRQYCTFVPFFSFGKMNNENELSGKIISHRALSNKIQ